MVGGVGNQRVTLFSLQHFAAAKLQLGGEVLSEAGAGSGKYVVWCEAEFLAKVETYIQQSW
jgi:hypothetical protein